MSKRICLALTICLAASSCFSHASIAAEKPNIVLIMADDK